MHNTEKFLKNIGDEDLLQIMFEAEEKGPAYVKALKEQLARLEEGA